VTSSKRHVLHALDEGKITRTEADAYLRAVHHTNLDLIERNHHAVAYSVILVMVAAIIGGIWLLPGGPTGYIVYDIPTEAHNITNTTINITQNITSLTVSGIMYGEGIATIRFATNDTNYTVTTLLSDTGAPRTTQPSYTPGENVTVENVQNATYYLDDGNQTTSVSVPFPAPAEGAYELLIIQNTSGVFESTRIDLIVSTQPRERTTPFTDACDETCTLPGIPGVLTIDTSGTIIDITTIDVTLDGENLEPIVTPMPDLTITGETLLDLDTYFTDPEGETLYYSTSQSTLVDASVTDNILTITPLQNGTELFIVYASDLEHLVQSIFTITSSMVTNETNVTIEENTTVVLPVAQNETNKTRGPNLRCDHPNPNLRPLDCLQEEGAEYFPTETIYWEDNYRTKVGRFNQLGNLLLIGDVIELSEGAPEGDDFRLGNIDRDGNLDATIWVDDDGNLHLTGVLFEEQAVMQPPPGSYSVLSRRSIYLAYADLNAGDLYLRGNVIPYRRSLG